MMNCSTLDELSHHFLSQLSVLIHAQQLSGASADDSFIQLVCNLNKSLDEIYKILKVMRHRVNEAKIQLGQNEELNNQLKTLAEQFQHALDNVPSRLSKLKPQHVVPVMPLQDSVDNRKMEPAVHSNECNYLRFLTVQEFESVPKYMKGRLTYDKVNHTVELLDKAYTEKYKILSQKKATLNDMNRKRCENYRSQEIKETKGVHFIVEKDITEFTSLKLDINARNILTILRHCGVIHEIRGGGHVRFGVV
ncbi:spindle and kinetochore-associated protein 1 [Biomphalaria pfeifferi]|uniref:SKA complex subunit 1 n=1 Tax=Biomphalaria pfeifferi TaxID=112525 RepID=A0AAD8B309_BIOPF|nr:spindle and kinetochore-associated protein 1 [Biomphalaria pfeifferi]